MVDKSPPSSMPGNDNDSPQSSHHAPKKATNPGGLKSALSTAFLAAGMPVTFKDVTYSVINSQNKREELVLLSSVSGYLLPGEMSALMGPSGSGKTSLLDILAGRKTTGKIEGEIKFSGERPSQMFLRRFTGYVEQFDTLLDILTVEEMLFYTAELKRPVEQSFSEKKAAVEELIDRLALDTCRNVRIGSPLARGISGGQAKRVNIGIALITNPRVLMLDEPTSGLDSYTANEVMSIVKSLSQMGITVVATVHSPTPYTFQLFDRLLLLLRGNVAYFGPNGKLALDYFHANSPHVDKLNEGENEAEWLVDLTTQADRQGRANEFAAVFAKSDLRAIADAEIEQQLAKASELDESDRKALSVRRATTTPFWWALRVLLKYRTAKNYRNGEFLGPRIGDKVIFSIIIFTLWWKVGNDFSQSNLPNIAAVLFMWVTLPAYGAAAYVPAIVLERPLFTRERNDGLYRVITYLCAKMIEELGIALLVSLIFSNLVFWTLKLQGLWVLFWLVYLCTLACGIVLAYFIAALSPNLDVANAALPSYVTTLLFFSGFLIRWDDIPNWWKWYAYIDLQRYAWGSLMKNQFGGNDPQFNGQTVLQFYSLEGISPWGWLGIEFAFFCVFFLGAFLALTYVRHVRR